MSQSFGKYITELRKRAGFKSQRAFSRATGVSAATISRIESEIQRPLPETLKAFAPHLRSVTHEELMLRVGYLYEKEVTTT